MSLKRQQQQARQRKIVAYMDLLRSSSPMPIPASDMRWVGLISSPNRTRTFGVKSPLTNNWIDFEVDDRVYHAKLPGIESGPVIDYYHSLRRIVDVARGIEVFKNELKAYDENEARIFGAVRSAISVRSKSRRFTLDD